MNKRTLFIRLAAASGYTGIGMLLGYSFSDQSIKTPLWVGVLLVLAAAVLIGMYVSARDQPEPFTRKHEGPQESKRPFGPTS